MKTLEEYINEVLERVPGSHFDGRSIVRGTDSIRIEGLVRSLNERNASLPQPWWWANQYVRALNKSGFAPCDTC